MEDRSPSVQSVRGEPWQHRASDERPGATREGDTTFIQQDNAGNDASKQEETVTFKSTDGDSYIWPFGLCRSLDAIKSLLEEVYTLRKDNVAVEAIRESRFDIQTDDGSIILPSVWSSIVKPSSTISIRFWMPEVILRPSPSSQRVVRQYKANVGFGDEPELISRPQPSSERVRRHSTQDANVRFRGEPSQDEKDNVYYQDVTIDVDDLDQSRRTRGRPASIGDASEDEGLDSETSSGSEDGKSEPSEPSEPPEPVRGVVSPLDGDGNRLSFEVDTKSGKLLLLPGTQPGSNGTIPGEPGAKKEVSEPRLETLRITRAMSTKSEGRSMVQVHVLPGPENVQLRQSVAMTWYHITLNRLDFTRFRSVCLAVPNLSDRSRLLTREMLAKIEKEKVNVFLDGMFIDPGTVLRADEKDRPDAQSVIFSCIPYFDLQAPASKSSSGPADRLFPARTLIQSYYPYEPVRERDEEQAYRRFSNDHSGSIIHVPTFWIMNIGSDVVVTCGYKPLSEELVKSITVVKEDLKQIGVGDINKNTLTKIRFTDWDGRVFIFPPGACRSYFQMEQKVRELRCTASRRHSRKSMHLQYKTQDDSKTVTPKTWKGVVSRTDCVSIDLNVLNEDASTPELDLSATSKSVLPFFHWPRVILDEAGKSKQKDEGLGNSGEDQPTACLEQVEKAIISETIDEYETANAVDKTFTSAAYYLSLKGTTHEGAWKGFASLMTEGMPKQGRHPATFHDIAVEEQCLNIVKTSGALLTIVDQTIGLFVGVENSSTLLCKVWHVMVSMQKRAEIVKRRVSMEIDPDAYSASQQRGWYIRNASKDSLMPLPGTGAHFKKYVQRCTRCRSVRPFDTPQAALEHLRKHVKPTVQPTTTSSPTGAQDASPPADGLPSDSDLEAWIVNSAQETLEETNAGALKILLLAWEIGSNLFTQAKELAEGVQNEDGQMSNLYTMPPAILEAFRKIIVFYIAIERALYYTEETCDNGIPQEPYKRSTLPYSKCGLEVLKRFGEGARGSLITARQQLCRMVRSVLPLDVFKHTSLGPEYVCAWLMRRLLVQPLEKRMTVADMYREYLSTIQFQVNHRPNKRLLRTINLLAEELLILQQVNTWQTALIQNYLTVLDDTTYSTDIPSRRSMFPYERTLLNTCLDNLDLARQDYIDLLRRCGPLSDRTKQSLEINEEDHGKAIMVFTIVTVIFLPLSFVTSYFGMNTADIRDMDSRQPLFWAVAIPLTVVTVGSCLLIGYNGDNLRDAVSSLFRSVTGKQDRGTSARGISFAQRKNVQKLQSISDTTSSLADEAEFASPRPEYEYTTYVQPPPVEEVVPYSTTVDIEPYTRTRHYTEREYDPYRVSQTRTRHDTYATERSRRYNDYHDEYYGPSPRRVHDPLPPPPPPPPHVRFRDDNEDDEPGRPTEYTWHKKRKGHSGGRNVRRSEGLAERNYSARMERESGEWRDGYGIQERRPTRRDSDSEEVRGYGGWVEREREGYGIPERRSTRGGANESVSEEVVY